MPGENVSWWSRIPRMVSIARREYGFARGGRAGGAAASARERLLAGLDVERAHLVDERTMHADEVRARGLGIRGGRRSEPAHELRDGGIDVPVEEEPAVVGERIPRVVREAAHDPVVHVPDRVPRQHEQVRRVKVRVEVPVDEHLVEHVPVEVAHDLVRVVAARPERREVVGVLVPRRDHDLVERDPLDELRGQDPRRRVVAIHASDALEAFADRVLMEEGRLARLDEIVELVGRPARELVDDLPRFRPPEQPRPVDDAADRVHQADVRPEVGADPGALDLDGNPLSGVEDRTMDLADRSGGEGPLLELGEHLLRRAAQLLRHDRSDVVVGERPDLAEQLEQLGAVRRREQVEAHRQHLAELDPRATELLDGEAHAHGARFRRGPERELGQDEVAREDDQDSPQPAGVAEEGHHRAHLPAAAMSTGAVGGLARHRIALRRQGIGSSHLSRRHRPSRRGVACAAVRTPPPNPDQRPPARRGCGATTS